MFQIVDVIILISGNNILNISFQACQIKLELYSLMSKLCIGNGRHDYSGTVRSTLYIYIAYFMLELTILLVVWGLV